MVQRDARFYVDERTKSDSKQNKICVVKGCYCGILLLMIYKEDNDEEQVKDHT